MGGLAAATNRRAPIAENPNPWIRNEIAESCATKPETGCSSSYLRGRSVPRSVYTGATSRRECGALPGPERLHLIDPWKYEPSAAYQESWYGGQRGVSQAYLDAIHDEVWRRFQHEIAAGVVQIHRANSSDAAADFPDGYFDWVYINGNHRYEFVKRDLEEYGAKLKDGGFLTGDDYGEEGWWQGGVTRAVNEFIAQGLCERVQIRNGQFCLRKTQNAI